MSEILRNTDGVYLTHEKFVKLRIRGELNLGVLDDTAAKFLLSSSEKYSNGQGVRYGFYLWGFAALGLIGYSVYLSFTTAWWAFIPGLLLGSWVERINKKSLQENCLDLALRNRDYYLDVMLRNGWVYSVKDSSELLAEILTEVNERYQTPREGKVVSKVVEVTKSDSFNDAVAPTKNKSEASAANVTANQKKINHQSVTQGLPLKNSVETRKSPTKQTVPTKKNVSSLESMVMVGVVVVAAWLFYAFGRYDSEILRVPQVPQISSSTEAYPQTISSSRAEEPVDFVGKSFRLKKPISTARRVYQTGEQLVVVSRDGAYYKIMTQRDGTTQEDEVEVERLREVQK